MKNKAKILSALLFVAAQLNAQTTGQNYVKSETMLDSLGQRRQTTVQYYDGLGRPTQSVTNALGGNGTYMATLKELDALDRETRSWLPQAVPSADYVSPSTFINSASASGTYPYADNTYDALDRLVQSCGAGAEWHTAGKSANKVYSTNRQNEVRKYSAPLEKNSLADKGYYAAGTLEVEETIDEDGKSLKVYKDFLGHVVLERRNGNNDTYFVYNDLGQLRYVLSPEYQYAHHKEQDEYNQSSGNSDYKKKYAYEYRYDERGRVVKKILPGSDYIQYWYDKADRLTYMCDANLREKGLYRFMFYDRFGRLAVQGVCSACDRSNIGILRAELNTKAASCIKNTGYAISNLDNDFRLKDVEIVNYYDNYNFLNCEMFRKSNWQQKMASASGACAVGLQTGSIVRTSNGEYLYNSVYYDAEGRTVRTFGTHLDGGMQETRTSYTFTNNPKVVSTTEYNANGDVEGSAEYTYAYNQYNDKLQSIDLRMNGEESAHRIAENTYDDLGRLQKVRRSGSAGDVDFAYNIRNWVTSISSKEFSETLYYTDGIGTPCYNGNISSMQWQNGASAAKSGYKFSYDGLNRLTSAIYGEGDDMSQNVNRFSEKGITYNANGSIYRMKRYGRLNDGSYGLVDDLKIKLDGNALYSITDYAAETNYKGSANFVDSDGSGQEYWFNGNGSLSADANKGIARIDYDNYGCPRKIVFTNGNTTEYVYSSTGEKLRTTHKTAIDGITVALNSNDNLKNDDFLSEDKTDYHGSFIYENGKLDKVLYPGGYVKKNVSRITLKPLYGGHTPYRVDTLTFYGDFYHYYTQDHLGNNRVVVSEFDGVRQETNYYPFGGVFSDHEAASVYKYPLVSICRWVGGEYIKGSDAQPYKYNGKELDRTHGLDWYDYGARQYDPFVPGFTSLDPMCEKYYYVSPYVYCLNNPVKHIDPDGKAPIGAIIGAVAGGVINGSYAYFVEGKTGWDLAGATIRGVAEGALVGATCGGGGTITKAAGFAHKSLAIGKVLVEGAATGAVGSVIEQGVSTTSISGIEAEKVAVDAALGAGSGFLGDLTATGVKKLTDNAIAGINSHYGSNVVWQQIKKKVIDESKKMGHPKPKGKAAKEAVNAATNRRIANLRKLDTQTTKMAGTACDYLQNNVNNWIVNGFFNQVRN